MDRGKMGGVNAFVEKKKDEKSEKNQLGVGGC